MLAIMPRDSFSVKLLLEITSTNCWEKVFEYYYFDETKPHIIVDDMVIDQEMVF